VRRPRNASAPAVVLVAILALVTAATGACAPRPTGAIAAAADLHDARFVVGGGPDDELKILCQLTVAAIEAAGGGAGDQCARYGALDVRLPAQRSFVDTGWAYLSRPDRDLDGRDDPPATWDRLARDGAAQGLTWLPPTAFSDGDVVVVAAGSPPGPVSALARRPGAWCATPGPSIARLAAAYRPADVRLVDAGAVVAGVARGDCRAGVVPSTSGRIPALGLVPLVDDRGALPRGGVAPVLRSEVVAAHPAIRTVLGMLTPRLTDDVVRGLDREVSQSGRDARDVAREWLADQGLT
jgi:osmoprotectant transport system substrate-binding protein